METFFLENEVLKVGIQTHGAEVCSIYHKPTGQQYLWQANPDYWGRHAPILFPIVGKLKDNKYSYKGQSYSLPQHGFARDKDFEFLSQDKNSIIFSLKSSEETKQVYPFDFKLQMAYVLSGNNLGIRCMVNGTKKDDLLFSVGFHPAFNCPLLPEENFEDYYLEFDLPMSTPRRLLSDGLFSGELQPLPWQDNILPLSYSLFEQDAIVFDNIGCQSVTLRNRRHAHYVKVGVQSFPYLGIWTKPGAPFLCIEPWFGLADSNTSTGNLEDKAGIIHLPADHTFTCVYEIEIG